MKRWDWGDGIKAGESDRGTRELRPFVLHTIPCTDHLDDLIMEGWMIEESRAKPRMMKMSR